MATALTCPHCQAQFGFDDWSKAASCPACGRRVSFFAASGRPEPEGGPAEGDGRSAAGATVQPGPISQSRPSRLVASMLDGGGLPQVAARLGIGHSTARTHLKHIFTKTQTRRQAELVELVHRLLH